MDKKRLLELAGITESDWSGELPIPGSLAQAMKNHKNYDQQKVEELLEAAIEAMAWIGYEGAGAADAKKRIEAAYKALTGHNTWERK